MRARRSGRDQGQRAGVPWAPERLLSRLAAGFPGLLFSCRRLPGGSLELLYGSAAVGQLLGLAAGEVEAEGEALLGLIHEEERARFRQLALDAAGRCRPFALELRLRHPGRGWLWVDLRATPEEEPDGSTLWHGIALDITERKRLQERLSAREREFRTLAENSPDPIVRYSRDCRRIYVNPTAARLGHPWRERPGTAGESPQPREAPEVCRAVESVFSTGRSGELMLRYPEGDGRERWFHHRYVPEFDRTGEVVSVLALGRDFTERQRAEEELRRGHSRLKEAVRLAQFASWEFDQRRRRMEWSEEAFLLFEADPATFEPSWEGFLAMVHPEDRGGVERAWQGSLKERLPRTVHYRLRLPDGRIKHVCERWVTEFDPAGAPLRSFGTVQDVTALREAELHLAEGLKRLRELAAYRERLREQERKQVAWELHEDLAQNLAALRMGFALLRRQLAGAPQLRAESESMAGLLDTVLEALLAMAAELRPMVLDHGLPETLEWLGCEFTRRTGVACRARIDPAVQLDEQQATLLYRVAEEALHNVARHADAAGVEMTLAREEGLCVLEIRDDGRGFDPDATGNRFGLLGMETRLNDADGTLAVESAPGAGTRLRAWLPLAAAR